MARSRRFINAGFFEGVVLCVFCRCLVFVVSVCYRMLF
jgi:hypothetical protein